MEEQGASYDIAARVSTATAMAAAPDVSYGLSRDGVYGARETRANRVLIRRENCV